MSGSEAVAAGLALVLAGWLCARAVAHAPLKLRVALLLDGMPALAGFVFLGLLTGRPLFSGLITAMLVAGYAGADLMKRRTLGEPVLFTDFFEAFDILKHPKICLIFPHPVALFVGAGSALAVGIASFLLEPAQWRPSPAFAFGFAVIVGVAAIASDRLLRERLASSMRRWKPSGRPRHDARRLGPFAMHFVYGTIARDERRARRASRPSGTLHVAGKFAAPRAPIVLVQSESFFDPRAVHPAVPCDLLSNYDRCRDESVAWGRMTVPARGANTVRTEFEVLSGLAGPRLGFDRFNPYRALARERIFSLAWQLRAEGFRTVCIHPFDKSFYRRDLVLGNLGFEQFLDEESFSGAARNGRYVADVEVANLTLQLVREMGPRLFVFAITMENHGPWGQAIAHRRSPLPHSLSALPGADAFAEYLSRISGTERLIARLREGLEEFGPDALLGFYGDHLPNFDGAFRSLGFNDRRSDYFLWRPGGNQAQRRDIAAHQLQRAIWDEYCLRAPRAQRDLEERTLVGVAAS